MIDQVLAKIFDTKNEREVKRVRPIVAAINEPRRPADYSPGMQ